MGNEQASQIVQAPSNQSEMARPPIMIFNTGTEDSGFFSENRKKPNNAVLHAAKERSSSANCQILPQKQEEVFGSRAECYRNRSLFVK